MALDLRPLTLTDILDRAARMYRGSFLSWLGVTAVLLVPQSIFVLAYMPSNSEMAGEPFSPSNVQRLVVVLLVAVLVVSIAQGAMAVMVAGHYLGRPVTLAEAYRRTISRLPSLLGGLSLTVLLVAVGLLLLIVPGVIFLFAFALVPAAILMEGVGARQAVARSWRLTRGDRGRVAAIGFVAAILQWVISFSVSVVAGLVWNGDTGKQIADQIATLLVLPFTQACIVLLYFDNRVKKEGFDLQMLMASESAPAAPVAPAGS